MWGRMLAFGVLIATWLLWSGVYQPLLIGLGIASSLVCVWIALRMGNIDRAESGGPPGGGRSSERAEDAARVHLSPTRTPVYWMWLTKEVVIANWQVIRIILSPRLDIHPVVATLKGSQRTNMGRVIYGNSITLTPGTLTIDIVDDQLTVHSLNREGLAALQEGRMDAKVTALE